VAPIYVWPECGKATCTLGTQAFNLLFNIPDILKTEHTQGNIKSVTIVINITPTYPKIEDKD